MATKAISARAGRHRFLHALGKRAWPARRPLAPGEEGPSRSAFDHTGYDLVALATEQPQLWAELQAAFGAKLQVGVPAGRGFEAISIVSKPRGGGRDDGKIGAK